MNKEEERIQIEKSIKKEVQRELEGKLDITDNQVLELIDRKIQIKGKETALALADKLIIRKNIFNAMRRLDVIQDFIEDSEVTEIMVNGTQPIYIEKEGRLLCTGKAFDSRERLNDIIQQIVSAANRTVNVASPIVDARLKDGSRINAVLYPIAVNGPILTIRRFPKVAISASKLIEMNSISEEIICFLKKIVESRYNILISGGTGAGKTTFLNMLSGFIPKDERIITIEDSAELNIQGISNLVSLEARNSNAEGCESISIRDLLRASLRMRPDRIIVGEVRGAESIDMLQAMNVGMDGSMSTIHANSADDALSRLETMMMLHTDIPIAALRKQIDSGIDIIIHLGRIRDKSRKLLEILEVTEIKGSEIITNPIYRFVEKGEFRGRIIGNFERIGSMTNIEKAIRAGITDEL